MDKFDQIYQDMVFFIKKKFPNFEHQTKKKYIYDFIKFNLPYIEDISLENIDIFLYKNIDIEIIQGLSYKSLFEKLNKQEIPLMWNYLNSLYILAMNSCGLKKIIDKEYKDNKLLHDIISSNNIIVENIITSRFIHLEPIKEPIEKKDKKEKKKKTNTKDPFEDLIKGTTIEKLANELKDNIDPNKEPNIADLITNIAPKLKEKLESGELDIKKDMSKILGENGEGIQKMFGSFMSEMMKQK